MPLAVPMPAWWAEMEGRLTQVAPADLPPVPWALHSAKSVMIGKSMFRGGPYETVIDNEAFLRTIKREVALGPGGTRARSGVLLGDLRALREALGKEKEKHGS